MAGGEALRGYPQRSALSPQPLKPSLTLVVLLGVWAAALAARGSLEAGQGLRAEYAGDRQWGRDTRTRVDREISTAAIDAAWQDSPPETFTVRWSGVLVVGRPAWYTFATTADDQSKATMD